MGGWQGRAENLANPRNLMGFLDAFKASLREFAAVRGPAFVCQAMPAGIDRPPM